ncbi:hypothetical protein CYMTET_24328 [Cymbomonas tetramitiformis]|uniref:Uncharacterized protein n=1 Tax=Cymbomonas tetramitiformis TaxID=36881 RepID=A0AAE0L018_9CHLO|nr:hypothetical protein CYMTET_24328 [Cymbomonas tetramitiformis]
MDEEQRVKSRFTVVGAGRVGTALADMDRSNALVVKRGDSIPVSGSGPIYVATHNADLSDVLAATPQNRRGDLVFLQNGMIRPWLTASELQDSTQALIYFAAALDESSGNVRVTDGGQTTVTGKYAKHFAKLLGSRGIACSVQPGDVFTQSMLEKLLWSTIFWMVCAGMENLTVGEVATAHRPKVHALVCELLPVAERALNRIPSSGIYHLPPCHHFVYRACSMSSL